MGVKTGAGAGAGAGEGEGTCCSWCMYGMFLEAEFSKALHPGPHPHKEAGVLQVRLGETTLHILVEQYTAVH